MLCPHGCASQLASSINIYIYISPIIIHHHPSSIIIYIYIIYIYISHLSSSISHHHTQNDCYQWYPIGDRGELFRNIHMVDASTAKLTSMHFHGWEKGLKTGMYLGTLGIFRDFSGVWGNSARDVFFSGWSRRMSCWGMIYIPSGKRLHNYGKSPFLMGKSIIKWPFSIAMLVYQRVASSIQEKMAFQMFQSGKAMVRFVV